MASRSADINSVEKIIEEQENEKLNLSLGSECPSTTVHSASSAADYQYGQQAMSLFTGADIHGGQFNISISSLNHSPTLDTPELTNGKHHSIHY